mgnify:CR=1 FL=1
MSILIETIRVSGLRCLQNIEINLEPVTVLTGMNNTGKTSFLKAMQIALGNRQFISQDDFYVSDNNSSDKIIVDIKIVPVDEDWNICNDFSENWEVLFTEDRIKIDLENKSFIPLRTIVTYDEIKATYKSTQYILPDWPLFKNESHVFWYQAENGKEKAFNYDEVSFFYMDAQRDILEDMKARNSYLGKMISKIEYSQEDVKNIEQQIKGLNEQAVSSSPILSNIKATLKELDSAMDTSSGGVEITPFTKKIRDLSKGLSIYYSDKKDSFSMEYHGMGTRSWSSLLTLKAFINLLDKNAEKEQTPFFPILAIEEPEAHLHPNAQKKLYSQIEGVKGQKIISTHSPYIAASAKLYQLRNFYKDDVSVACGAINTQELTSEDIRKIERQVINTRGELLFSKAIIFFEGETEEQALPIFAEHFFKKPLVEIGIDFVGVGGHGNYLPFLRVAEALKIPWFILGDGGKDAIESIKKALKKLYNREIEIEKESNIFILDNECDFEKYLLKTGYLDEIKSAFVKLHSHAYLEDEIRKKDGTKRERIKTDAVCDKCSQNIYQDILRNYNGDHGFKDALYDCMISQKTQFGPVIAEAIIESNKTLPPKVTELFEKIKSLLEKRDVDE